MRLRIRHETRYAYETPLIGMVQYLRMSPRDSARQKVHRWSVVAPGSPAQWTDHHGNRCHALNVDRATDEVTIIARGEVETFDTAGVVSAAQATLPERVYLRETAFTRPDGRVRDVAEPVRRLMDRDRLDGLHELMNRVHRAVRYVEGATHVHTTASQALEDGSGVCQDHAHVFIACCRALGVPARYVGGYLLSSDDATEEQDAGHAWASALVPDFGWVSFDAANGVSATQHYVAAAVGLDYAEASPARGVRRGGGEETMTVRVAVSLAPPS